MRWILSLLLSISCFGAIANDGSGSGTTTLTFSGTATGDLKLIYAYRSGSSTAPSLPAGWTTVATGNAGAGGTLGSYRIGCNVSSSGADTGSGTWTNATNIAGVSYSGTLVSLTTNCNSTGVGNFLSSSAKASTTASYGGITIQAANNWVAGFMGGSAGSTCVPGTLTSRSTTGDALAADTNATVSSFSTGTCTVSSETWMTFTVELLGPIPTCSGTCPTLVSSFSSNNAGENINLPVITYGGLLGTGTLAGNLLELTMVYPHGSAITSVVDNLTSTYTSAGTSDGGVGGFVVEKRYVANTGAGITTITITFVGTIADFHGSLKEYQNIATSTPQDGSACTATAATGSNVVACTGSITTTGTNSIISFSAFAEAGAGLGVSNVILQNGIVPGFPFTADTDGNYENGSISESYVVPSASSITPSAIFTQTTHDTFVALGVAYKSASSGSGPGAAIQILNIERFHMYDSGISGCTTCTFTLFPVRGNAIVCVVDIQNSNSGGNIVAVSSSSPSVSFTKYAPTSANFQIFWATGITPSTSQQITWTNGAAGDTTLTTCYDIGNAQVSAHDVDANSSGNQTSGGDDITAAPNITPTAQPGISFEVVGFGNGPTCSVTTAGAIYDNIPYLGETDSSRMNNGNASSHVWYTSTSLINWGYHTKNGTLGTCQTSGGVGSAWGSSATTIKGPSSTPSSNTGPAKRRLMLRKDL